MGRLTTHVLDIAQGIPAADVKIVLNRVNGDTRTVIATAITNRDGRVDRPLLDGDDLVAATYELVFDIEAYFRNQPLDVRQPPFLDFVTIRFTIVDASESCHVPLLVSPWAYSIYRGS